MDQVFTTKGYLPAEQVEMRESVTEDNDDRKTVRVDKYLRASGEWIGNDVHVTLKRVPSMTGEQGAFA